MKVIKLIWPYHLKITVICVFLYNYYYYNMYYFYMGRLSFRRVTFFSIITIFRGAL